MYSLVTLLSLLWYLAVARAEERPTNTRLGVVAVLVAVLALTHYWAMFLFGAYAILAVVGRRRGRPTARLLMAHVLGGLAFLPWLPSFLYQLRHTGTPWAERQNPASTVVTMLADLAGGRQEGAALGLLALLFFRSRWLCWSGDPFGPARTRPDGSGGNAAIRRTPRPHADPCDYGDHGHVVCVRRALHRYCRWPHARVGGRRRIRDLATDSPGCRPGSGCRAGLAAGWVAVDTTRSQGQQIAAAIAADFQPGDVVVACPDQIGPATARYLPDGVAAVSYPLLADARLVDWVDYADRNAAGSPSAVADQLVERAAGHRIWLVWQVGYRTLEGQCEALRSELASRVPGREVISPDPAVFEPMWLSVYEPVGAT
ncbi:MAG: hypothetical protein R2706_17475 [Acidimicrobiales bacterium]